ncbi:hypothetical protein VCUG_01985 [Vavraia culicis subsp. floridensis]|uniref:UBA domain-containing protein n=1 Tax=Vavraia culicis (isolate floridensis) TaxID=948595 RepID=L2GT57_VAVCU|nr:uncharacterized protein VCUG_01985 [Vavraia culicis subsp. floridensis]ELA46552.1 hypothetical protein VCUG_01985 [Vavraia culicis subsp. floridensis]
MPSPDQVQKLMSACNISKQEAERLLKLSNNDVDLAITIHNQAKDEMYVGSGLAVNKPNRKHTIKMYKNGVSVDNHFMEMNAEGIKRLRTMIERGEFDAKMVGGRENEMAEFEVENYDVEYGKVDKAESKIDYSKIPSIGRRVIPKIIVMDKSDQSVSVNIRFVGLVREIRVSKNCKVKDLLEFLFKYTKTNLALLSNGKKIGKNDLVTKHGGSDLKIEND